MFIKYETMSPIDFSGLKIVDYTAGQENSSSFAEITVPAGISHKVSWSNRSDKYYYVIRGCIDFTINNETKKLFSGDFCIVTKGIRFSYTNSGSDDAKLILVHTPGFKLEYEMFEE